jgi:hypothetical protein
MTTFRHERGCVIDIETVPDRDAVELAPSSARGGWQRPLLHKVVAASALTFERDRRDGGFRRLRLSSWHGGRMAEAQIIGCVDGALPDPALEGATLVTFNGAAHDLPILRARAMSLWMFDLPRLRAWDGERERHRDLIYAFGARGKRPSLAEVGASIGTRVACRPREANSARCVEEADWTPIVHKCEADVAATFIAFAYDAAWRSGDDRLVASAWVALAEALAARGERAHHLHHLRYHHLVDAGRLRLEMRATGG